MCTIERDKKNDRLEQDRKANEVEGFKNLIKNPHIGEHQRRLLSEFLGVEEEKTVAVEKVDLQKEIDRLKADNERLRREHETVTKHMNEISDSGKNAMDIMIEESTRALLIYRKEREEANKRHCEKVRELTDRISKLNKENDELKQVFVTMKRLMTLDKKDTEDKVFHDNISGLLSVCDKHGPNTLAIINKLLQE